MWNSTQFLNDFDVRSALGADTLSAGQHSSIFGCGTRCNTLINLINSTSIFQTKRIETMLQRCCAAGVAHTDLKQPKKAPKSLRNLTSKFHARLYRCFSQAICQLTKLHFESIATQP